MELAWDYPGVAVQSEMPFAVVIDFILDGHAVCCVPRCMLLLRNSRSACHCLCPPGGHDAAKQQAAHQECMMLQNCRSACNCLLLPGARVRYVAESLLSWCGATTPRHKWCVPVLTFFSVVPHIARLAMRL